MKNVICAFCSLVIMVMCLGGCSGSSSNPFTADDAKKGQIGDLYYVVPSNAVSDNKVSDSGSNNDGVSYTDGVSYRVPIEGSVEEYTLNIAHVYVSQEEAETEEEVHEGFETVIKLLSGTLFTEADAETDTQLLTEDIDEFAGMTVDRGIKISGETNGLKGVTIMAYKSRKMYSVSYSAKTGFFDQSVFDDFFNQLKIIESD